MCSSDLAQDALTLKAPQGSIHISGSSDPLVGAGAGGVVLSGAVSFSSDGAMTSGPDAMKFSTYDEFGTFRSKSLFSASTTVVGALNELADNISALNPGMYKPTSAADKATGADVALSKVAGTGGTNLTPSTKMAQAQCYVNGQLMASGSIAEVSGGDADFRIKGNDILVFSFDILSHDQIIVFDYNTSD